MTDRHLDGATRDAANDIAPEVRTAYWAIEEQLAKLSPAARARVILKFQRMTSEEIRALTAKFVAEGLLHG